MSATASPNADGLNPFPGYPVVSIGGEPDRTVVTLEIGKSRDVVREHVTRWRPVDVSGRETTPDPSEAGDGQATPKPVEWSSIMLVSGDYGTGKTHLLIDCANFLKDQFARSRAIQQMIVVRAAALGATPSRWYRDLLGAALGNYDGRTADGGLFTRLVLQVYSMAAKSLLDKNEIDTDSLNAQPVIAMRLVSEGLLNATAVWSVFQAAIRRCCSRAPVSAGDRFAAVLDPLSRAEAERWLAGGDGEADAPSDQEAAGIIAATAALCSVAGWPFALFIDEIEQFLREDDRAGTEVNTTWLKRLLGDLAEAGAFVAVGGHVSAWERRRDFLDRFSGGASRIDMRRLQGSDVLALVTDRAGPNTNFDPTQAGVIADVCKGNVRRILALCRVLYDRSGKFSLPLTEKEIRERGAELGQALNRDQALLNIREAFETRGYAVRQEMMDGSGRFDLVARGGAAAVFVVTVRSTPEIKEAQDLAIQFVRQINASRRPGERVQGFFVCDTPEDRGLREALRDWPDIDLAWFDYTDRDSFAAIRQAIDRGSRAPALVAGGSSPAPDLSGQLEAAVNKRLNELDRQRTNELKELYQRLGEAEHRARAMEDAAQAVQDRLPPGPPPDRQTQTVQFSAADLLAKPSRGFQLRVLMSSTGSWIALTLLPLGLLIASASSRLASLMIPQLNPQNYPSPADYNGLLDRWSFGFLMGGFAFAILATILLLRRYFEIANYFDYAYQLVREEYLAAPHPWLLTGANRIARQLVLVSGPRQGTLLLQKEIAELIGRRTAMPAQPSAGKADPADPAIRPR